MHSLGKITSALLECALLAALLAGCAGSGERIRVGAPSDIGQGNARAFITLDRDGRPTVIGVRLSEASLAGLPAEPPANADRWEYDLQLPPEAAISGFKHVGIVWYPAGHVPPSIYDKPHFDFRFYLISAEERNKITLEGEDLARANKTPPTGFLPEGYILPEGTEVPRLGAHAVNPGADEFKGKPFRKAVVYGYYDGRMTVLEPMIAKSYLDTKPKYTDPVTLPRAFAAHGYYPTRYSIRYDDARREFELLLKNLEYR